jgi:hypothetical protein
MTAQHGLALSHTARLVLGVVFLPQIVAAVATLPPNDISATSTLVAANPTALVIVSDHGTGSSSYLAALGKHQCVFSIGEPFDGAIVKQTDWRLEATGRNAKLEQNIALARRRKRADTGQDWPVELPLPTQVWEDLGTEGLAAYFTHITNHVCEAMPDELVTNCSSSCVVAFKTFPAYVGGNTDDCNSPRVFDDKDLDGQAFFNMSGLDLWDRSLKKMRAQPHLQMMLLTRDEEDRQLSNWRRFTDGWRSWYNCDVPRHGRQTVFAQRARAIVGDKGVVPVEACFKDEPGAKHCIQKSLDTVRLSVKDVDVSLMTEGNGIRTKSGIEHANCDSGGWLTIDGGNAKKVPENEVNEKIEDAMRHYAAKSQDEGGSKLVTGNLIAPTKVFPDISLPRAAVMP